MRRETIGYMNWMAENPGQTYAVTTEPKSFSDLIPGRDGETTEFVEFIADPSPTPEEQVMLRMEVQDVLAQMPPQVQTALVLRYMEGLSWNETAAAMGVQEAGLRGNVARTIVEFRNEL